MIIILDLKTYKENNSTILNPFSIGIYLENKYYNFYLENKNYNLLINSSIEFLFKIKNINNYTIYVHDLGKFESYFLLNYINYKYKIVSQNNFIYKLEVFQKSKKLNIHDSYKIMNMSLQDCCKGFSINYEKKNTDYCENNIFNQKYKNLAIKELENDSYSLYKIMKIFTDRVIYDYNIKPKNYLTIGSLGYKIWKLDNYYIEKNTIQNIWKDKFIRESYFGGRCEIYKPYIENGYFYDINSFYPYIMNESEFPISDGKFINGINVTDDFLDKFLGFYECEVEINQDIYIPILPFRNQDLQSSFPLGKFKGVYFSKEILLAKKFNYKIKINCGLYYEKKDKIFKNFIQNTYKKRLNSNNQTEGLIYKNLMNSLSGKFGMKPEFQYQSIISLNNFKNLKDEIFSINYIKDDQYLVTCVKKNKWQNSSVQISSIITSNARIYLYETLYYLKLHNINIFYVDTDGFVTDKPIPEILICKKTLGKFKLEYKIKRGYFLALKTYLVITENNKKITKFKGLHEAEANQIDEVIFKNYLYNHINNLIFYNTYKYYKNIKLFKIKENKMNLKIPFNYDKRNKIYDKSGNWKDTAPKIIK